LQELFDRAAAGVGHHLRRVAGVVAPQKLHHAVRVLKRLIARRIAAGSLRGGALRVLVAARAAHDPVAMHSMAALTVLRLPATLRLVLFRLEAGRMLIAPVARLAVVL